MYKIREKLKSISEQYKSIYEKCHNSTRVSIPATTLPIYKELKSSNYISNHFHVRNVIFTSNFHKFCTKLIFFCNFYRKFIQFVLKDKEFPTDMTHFIYKIAIFLHYIYDLFISCINIKSNSNYLDFF